MDRLQNTLAELDRSRTLAIQHIRNSFAVHGFNVDAWPDNEVSGAVLGESVGAVNSHDLFERAFLRLQARGG